MAGAISQLPDVAEHGITLIWTTGDSIRNRAAALGYFLDGRREGAIDR